jgi:hypothetical protein
MQSQNRKYRGIHHHTCTFRISDSNKQARRGTGERAGESESRGESREKSRGI